MNFDDYYPLALRTAKVFISPRENLRHAALGLITELGEFTTEVKRIAIYGRPMSDEMRAHMIEEIGDAMWYVPLALSTFDAKTLVYFEPGDPSAKRVEAIDNLADAAVAAAVCMAPIVAHLIVAEDADAVMMFGALSVLVHLIDKRIAPMLGTTGDEIRAANIAKLRERYPDKYTDEAAEARADKAGLPASQS